MYLLNYSNLLSSVEKLPDQPTWVQSRNYKKIKLFHFNQEKKWYPREYVISIIKTKTLRNPKQLKIIEKQPAAPVEMQCHLIGSTMLNCIDNVETVVGQKSERVTAIAQIYGN